MTFSTVSFVGGCVAGGYACSDGFALQTKSNSGICASDVRDGESPESLGLREERTSTHGEVLVDTNDRGRGERQTQAVREREPVPELLEEGHADESGHVATPALVLHRDRHVATSGVDDTLRDGRSELGHRVLVFVGEDRRVLLSHRSDLRRRGVILLDEDHGERHAGTLANEIDGVLRERLEESDCILYGRKSQSRQAQGGNAFIRSEQTHLETCSSAGDSERHRTSVSDVRVVALTQELNNSRHLLRVAEEEEAECRDGRATNVVRNVRDGNVEEFADCRIRSGAGVCERESVDTAVSKDCVLFE